MSPPKMSMSPITFRKAKNSGVSKGPPKAKNSGGEGGGILTQMRRRISGHESQLTTKLQLASSSGVSSENPMFHVKAPSFSSHTGRRDRSTIRRSGRESRVDELLMEEGIDVRDRRSMRRAERKAERKGTMGTDATAASVSTSSKRSDNADSSSSSSKRAAKRAEKAKKEQRSRTTGRMNTNTSTSTPVAERRRSMYEPQSGEMDASEWVTRMAGVMELRKKHRSFRRAEVEDLPADLEVTVASSSSRR
jgi:hypothetical protein